MITLKAVRMRDEEAFLNTILNNCKNSLQFLFGTDSATKATMFYNKALEQAREEDKHKYILITDKSNYNLHDANLQFKDSYVSIHLKLLMVLTLIILTARRMFLFTLKEIVSNLAVFLNKRLDVDTLKHCIITVS